MNPVRDTHDVVLPRGPLTCRFCGEEEDFGAAERPAPQYLIIGYLELTGTMSIGIGPDGRLVVLAEVRWWYGKPAGWLAHVCPAIPAGLYEQYADEIAERRSREESAG